MPTIFGTPAFRQSPTSVPPIQFPRKQKVEAYLGGEISSNFARHEISKLPPILARSDCVGADTLGPFQDGVERQRPSESVVKIP